jgi:hypothetical protein
MKGPGSLRHVHYIKAKEMPPSKASEHEGVHLMYAPWGLKSEEYNTAPGLSK